MKAQNHQEINKAYLKFSGYLAACVAIGVLSFSFYKQAERVEVSRIVAKTGEYDKIHAGQTDLVGRIDSLYYYTALLNTTLNDAALMNVVNRRKQELQSEINGMNGSDVRLYKLLVAEYNGFLGVKDSIRLLRQEEELVKSDLMKCMEENRNTTRRLRIGGSTINR